MARWTQNDKENQHLRKINEQIFDCLGKGKAHIVLKDGSHLVGEIFPKATGNNRGTGMPERGWSMAKVSTDQGEIEIDVLDIENVFAGAPN